MRGICPFCGVEKQLFQCEYCGGRYCGEHVTPREHNCPKYPWVSRTRHKRKY